MPDWRRPAKILSFYCSLPYLSAPFSEWRLLESSEHYVLMLTTIANFIIRSSIVAPDQSSLKPDTHDETFVCNLCMQLLCVPYTTVQTMQLHITCCSFPLKLCILFQHGAYWACWGGRNCCLIVSDDHCTCNATFKWTANNTKFGFNEEMYIGLTILYLAKRPLS